MTSPKTEAKISVIVPVYNCRDYLERCIRSVQSQTYQNWELLLIDDGSTDCSGQICDDFSGQDSRIKVYHKENGGVSSARNYGIEKAQGIFLCFLDSDDSLEPDYYAAMTEGGAGRTDVCVISGYRFDYGSRSELLEAKEANYTLQEFRANFDELYLGRLLNVVWNKLFPREIIGDTRFPHGISMGEDLMFNLEVYSKCPNFRCITNTGYHYNRTVGTSLSRVYKENYTDCIIESWRRAKRFRYCSEAPVANGDSIDVCCCIPLYDWLQIVYLSFGSEKVISLMKKYLQEPDYRECVLSVDQMPGSYQKVHSCVKKGNTSGVLFYFLLQKIKMNLKKMLFPKRSI